MPKSTKAAAKPTAVRHRSLSPLQFLKLSVQMATPGLLDADERFRENTIDHLVDRHRAEVLSELAAAKHARPRERRLEVVPIPSNDTALQMFD